MSAGPGFGKLGRALELLAWNLISGIIISYFFISTYLYSYSTLPLRDASAIFFGPLFCGIMLGIILKESEMPILVFSVLLTTVISLLILLFVFLSPALLGVPMAYIILNMEVATLLSIAALFIVPLSLIGVVIGKTLGETMFLSREEREKLARLRAETKDWHRELARK